MSFKKSLLLICKFLGLFVNTLTADDKYFLLNRDILRQPNEMHLSNKQKRFTNFFIHFLKSRSNFKHFEKPKTFCELFSPYLKSRSNFENSQKKDDPHRLCIFDITDFEKRT